MKNTFKLMGLALLAGAMLFTACKKDEEDTDNNTNNTVVPAISISYNGQSATSDTVFASIEGTGEDQTIQGGIYYGSNPESYIDFYCGTAKSRYSLDGTRWYVRYYADADDEEATATSTQNGSITISALDVTAHTISAAISAEMGEANSGNMLTAAIANAVLAN